MAAEFTTPKHETPCRGGFKTRPYQLDLHAKACGYRK